MLLKTLALRKALGSNLVPRIELPLSNMINMRADSTYQHHDADQHTHQYASATTAGPESSAVASTKRIVHDTMGIIEVSSDK